MKNKTTTLADALFQKLCFDKGNYVKATLNGKPALEKVALSFGELKKLAENEGFEVTKDTNKKDLIAFFYSK